MQSTPRMANPAPAIAYGQRAEWVSDGTTLPSPRATASEVRPVRHQARYVRSLASLVRRSASRVSSNDRLPPGLSVRRSSCWSPAIPAEAYPEPPPHLGSGGDLQ